MAYVLADRFSGQSRKQTESDSVVHFLSPSMHHQPDVTRHPSNRMKSANDETMQHCTLCGSTFASRLGCACSIFPPRLEDQQFISIHRSHTEPDRTDKPHEVARLQANNSGECTGAVPYIVWCIPCAKRGRLDCDLTDSESCSYCVGIAASCGGALDCCRQAPWKPINKLPPVLQDIIRKYGGIAQAKVAVTLPAQPMELAQRPLFDWCSAWAVRGNIYCECTSQKFCTDCLEAFHNGVDLALHCEDGRGMWPRCSMDRAQLEHRIIEYRAIGKLRPAPAPGSAESLQAESLYRKDEKAHIRRAEVSKAKGRGTSSFYAKREARQDVFLAVAKEQVRREETSSHPGPVGAEQGHISALGQSDVGQDSVNAATDDSLAVEKTPNAGDGNAETQRYASTPSDDRGGRMPLEMEVRLLKRDLEASQAELEQVKRQCREHSHCKPGR